MSVSLEMLVPYDFHNIADREESTAEIYAIKKRFEDYFHIVHGINVHIEIYEDGNNVYSILLNFGDISIELGNGFLLISGGWNYSQYFYSIEGLSYLRNLHFDILSALSKSEAFIMDEFHGTNAAYGNTGFGMNDMTITNWLQKNPCPPILQDSQLRKHPEWDKIENVYLDKFTECKKRKEVLQTRFSELKILTTCPFVSNFLLALKGDNLVFLNEENGKILNTGRIDGFDVNFNQNGFVIFKGNNAAFFTPDGKRVTPYRVHRFLLKYLTKDRPPYSKKVIVYEEKTEQIVYSRVVR